MISVVTNTTTTPELGSSNGVLYSLRSKDNYLYDGAECTNNASKAVGVGWFRNVDITVAPTRNEDGTIDMHGLLEPNGLAPKDAGARLVVDGDAVSTQPKITTVIAGEVPVEPVEEVQEEAAEGNGGNALPIALGGAFVAVAGALVAVNQKKKKK